MKKSKKFILIIASSVIGSFCLLYFLGGYVAAICVADALFAADERQRFRNVLRFALCFGTALEAHRCFAEKHAAAVLRVHCRNGCLALHGDIAAEQRSYAYLARCQNAAFDAAAIGFGGSGYVLLRAAAHRKSPA